MVLEWRPWDTGMQWCDLREAVGIGLVGISCDE